MSEMSEISETEKEYLIYMTIEDPDKRGNNIFKFYFSKNPQDAEGIGWYETPAYNNAELPRREFISSEIILTTNKIQFDAPQYNEQINFSYVDVCEHVVAVVWEDVNCDEYDIYNNGNYRRIVFHYGHEKKFVESILEERELSNKYAVLR